MLLAWPAIGTAKDRDVVVTLLNGLPFVRIPRTSYQRSAAVPGAPRRIRVPAFSLMTRPVTNEEFLAFVRAQSAYRRDGIARVFADENYLGHWTGPGELGAQARPQQPVTRVSWFAAKAFCEHHGVRLPTEAEWELAAAASPTERDARNDPAFRQQLLDWYSTPTTALPDVPHGAPNVYGVSDLHGVIWEWVLDFNRLVSGDSRAAGDSTRGQICGVVPGGATGDKRDYATFMRLAMRSSLRADYTTTNLGFRCAADAAAEKRRAR